jgi:hypothetical protein
MNRIKKLLPVLLIILITACNEAYDVKMKEIDTPQNQALMREKLTREEYIYLRHARLRYSIAGRENALKDKTVGDLIKEQRKLEDLALEKRLDRQKKLSKYISLDRSDSSRFLNNSYYLETRIQNKGDKTIKTIRFKVNLYEEHISEAIIRRFQASDINLQSGSEYSALHRISPQNKAEDNILRKGNELYVEYEPIGIIFSDGSTVDTD